MRASDANDSVLSYSEQMKRGVYEQGQEELANRRQENRKGQRVQPFHSLPKRRMSLYLYASGENPAKKCE